MKNKKLLTLLIASGLMLAACGGKKKKVEPTPSPTGGEPTQPASPTGQPSSPVAPTTEPSSPVAPTSEPVGPTSSAAPTTEQGVIHQDPFVREVAAGTLLRSFNEKYDVMVDDFSSDSLKGELVGERNPGLLRVLVDSETGEGEFPSSPDASIYKTAAGVFDSAHPDVIGFKMRKVGEGTLNLKDLILGLRGDDAYKVFEINLADALNSDNEELPELTAEWQDIEVDFGNTIEDDTTEYELKDGGASGVRVLDKMVGFHLYANANSDISQIIEIAEVYSVKGVTKTVVDNFDHPLVNKNPSFGPYWVDSTGFIVRRGVNIAKGSYEVTLPAEAQGFENLVLELNGDGSTLKVNGQDAPLGAVNGAFFDFVLNLEEAGVTLGETVKLESTGDLNVSAIFVSNLQEKEAVKDYPVIDIENRVVFDDFERDQNEFIADWDTASTADYSPDGISVALSYSQGNLASVHDGLLKIAQPTEGYVNVKEACVAAENPLQYLVIVAKGNLEGFRLGSSEVMYSHDWLAGPGLKSIPEDLESYPYQHDGFVHYIIDLEEMGSDIGKDAFIDMYFNNEIDIDSIYFARAAASYQKETNNLNTSESLGGYKYLGYAYLANAYQLDLHIEGEGNLTSIRFSNDAGEFWFKDGKVIGLDGQPISADLTFDAEHPLTVKIDAIASGFGEFVHVHGGAEWATGSITALSYTRHYTDPWREVRTQALNPGVDNNYSYLGAYGQENDPASILEIEMFADKEGATLETFRIEGAETLFANQGKLIGDDGQVIAADTPISADAEHKTVIRIDVAASFGASQQFKDDDGFMHFHFGGWGASGATVNFSLRAYVPFTAEYELDWFYAK